FYSQADDGERLYLDGAKVIDQWAWDGGLENSYLARGLSAGWHAITYEVHESTGNAAAWLSWQGPAVPKQLIPDRFLTADLARLPGDYGSDDDFRLLPGSPA